MPVRPGGGRRIGDCGLLGPARSATAQARCPHQPRHALSGVPMAAATQFGVDAWCAVAALGRLVELVDVLG
jgi:hypothetical protein